MISRIVLYLMIVYKAGNTEQNILICITNQIQIIKWCRFPQNYYNGFKYLNNGKE